MGRLFDDDGKLIDPEGLHGVQLGTKRQAKVWTDGDGTRKQQLLHEDDGRVAAVTTEHGDGRVDAQVFARPSTIRTRNSL